MLCQHCKSKFKARRSTAKFCSDNCRVTHRNHIRKELIRNDWHSPEEIVEAARQVMGGIDLDPASCEKANQVVKAEKFYSVKDDGLKQPWFGKVWLNPPYGRFAPKFIERFGQFFSAGKIEQGILLLGTHHLTTAWISSVMCLDPLVCFPTKRVKFSQSDERPAHGSVILGVGVESESFSQVFGSVGWIFRSQIAR